MFKFNKINNVLHRLYSSSKILPISNVLKNCVLGDKIQIKGWVKSLRKMKETAFLDINDGSCRQNLQVVLPIEQLKLLSTGSSVIAKGTLTKTPRGQLELNSHLVEVYGDSNLNDGYPFAPKKTYSPVYLRQCLQFRLRDTKFASFLRVRDAAFLAVHNYFCKNGYINVHTPILTSNDCEGAGEIFSVVPDNKNMLKRMNTDHIADDETYFDSKVFLTVSGQLHLEAAAHSLSKVYSFGPTFRAENSKSRLHLSEFYMIEAECAFMDDLEQLMDMIENLIKTVTNEILYAKDDDIDKFKEGQLDFSWLSKEFAVLTYKEATTLLSNSSNFKFIPNSSLNKEHEHFLVKHCGNVPTFVINWPKALKPFYAKEQEDSHVAALDLLVPNVGELVGGSLRENDYELLKNKLPSNALDWYLDLRKFGGVPTGGFGLGFERYLQFVLGIGNIKDAIPFPRWPHNSDIEEIKEGAWSLQDIYFTIKYKDKVGRYATADVDLKPGDFIFAETSFAFGPKSDSPPLCLGCHIPLDCTTLCSTCKWPVCNTNCELNPVHKKFECAVFSKAKVHFQKIFDLNEPCLQYECITPLRVLLSMLQNNDRWIQEVKDMEAHNDKRRNTSIWRFNQINIVNYLRGPCRLKMFDEELIHTVCGILECNAFEARSKSGYPIRCLFPKLSILSHNCISNISHTIVCDENADYRVTVRATTETKKGGELFSSYTYALWPTMVRRQHLKESKYFFCTCDRCSDSTEIGTHMSSLICNKCNIGVLYGNDNWACLNCGDSRTSVEVQKLFETIQNEIDAANIADLEGIMEKYVSVLHPHNSYLVMMKLSLIPIFRRTNIQKAIQFCKDALYILNVVEPGCTRIRGTTLYELSLATFSLIGRLQKQKQNELICREMQNVVKYLEECVPILIREPDYTFEGKAGTIAMRQLENLKRNFKNVINGSNIIDIINNA
ncbi:hypothetical protein RN001_003857 [Aquatica leii]|uniref:asparagine--tRNA ligase n=1 Tax=Aquatica leii TaxID=1421715 RepID=A0AAN7PRK8_9COLE|nr:hypothetical protein RN001_003857 [Aquatica leii]